MGETFTIIQLLFLHQVKCRKDTWHLLSSHSAILTEVSLSYNRNSYWTPIQLFFKLLFYSKENYNLLTLFSDETQVVIQESSVTNFSDIFMAMLFCLQAVHMQTYFLSQPYLGSCWWDNCLAPFCSHYHWVITHFRWNNFQSYQTPNFSLQDKINYTMGDT